MPDVGSSLCSNAFHLMSHTELSCLWFVSCLVNQVAETSILDQIIPRFQAVIHFSSGSVASAVSACSLQQVMCNSEQPVASRGQIAPSPLILLWGSFEAGQC